MASNYKFMRISRSGYLSVFDDLQVQDPGFRDAGFDAQMQAYFAKSFVYGDSFTRAMQDLGNETLEVVCNAEVVQKAWADDRGVDYDDDWVRQISWAQVAWFRPDVIYVQGLTADPTGFLPENGFREQFPFVKLVIGYTGFPHAADRLDGVDLVVSGIPSIQRYYIDHGRDCPLMYHCFDPAVLEKLAPVKKESDVELSFIGSTGLGYGDAHVSRYWELVELCAGTGLQVWGDERYDPRQIALSPEQLAGLGQQLVDMAKSLPAGEVVGSARESLSQALGTDHPMLPLSMMFPGQLHDAVYGLDMYDVLRRSEVTVNRHTDAIGFEVGNMRMFEATGVGTCMLVNEGANMRDLYEPDEEVVVYGSGEECAEKAKWLLANDDKRREIALAGQKRTLRDHSVERRCEAVDEMIRAAI